MNARTRSSIAVAYFTAVGALLRLLWLPEQSLWFDEWVHFNLLSCPNLREFISNYIFIAPEHSAAPLFYYTFYLSSWLLGTAPTSLRLFPVLLGTISIYLIYQVGCGMGRPRAGLIAALLLALSPLQIWYSQELRTYTLLVFLVLVSLQTLLKWANSPRWYWLAIHCFLNALIVFTHLFAFLAILPFCIYVWLRRGFATAVLHGIVHAVFIGTLVLYALNMPHYSESTSRAYLSPGVSGFVSGCLFKDVISTKSVAAPASDFNAIHPTQTWLDTVLIAQPFFNGLLQAGLVLLVLLFIAGILMRMALSKRPWQAPECGTIFSPGSLFALCPWPSISTNAESERRDACNDLLLILLIFLPGLILAGAQTLLRLPFISPSYDLYNTVGIYLVVGTVLSKFKPLVFRFALLLTLLLYGYQSLIMLPVNTRPNWKAGAAYIRDNATPRDLILDECVLTPISRYSPYLESLGLPVTNIGSYADACHHAADFFLHQADRETTPGCSVEPSVWMLTEPVYAARGMTGNSPHPVKTLQEGLAEFNLTAEIREFPGGTYLTVLQIRPLPGTRPRFPHPYSQSLNRHFDYETIIAELGLSPQDQREKDLMIAALQRAICLWPVHYIHTYNRQISILLLNGAPEIAEALAQHAIRRHPSFGVVYYGMGLALAYQGQDVRAWPYFRKAFSHYPALEDSARPFVEALCVNGDYREAQEALDRLASFPFPFYHLAASHLLEQRLIATQAVGDVALVSDARQTPLAEIAPLTAGVEARRPNDASVSPEIRSDWVISEAFIPPGDPPWIETLFDAQGRLSGLHYWMPLSRHIARLRATLSFRLTGDVAKAISQYETLIDKSPFDKDIYVGYDKLLRHAHDPDAYVAVWLDRGQNNPDLAPFAARIVAERGSEWLAEARPGNALKAYSAARTLDGKNVRHVLRLAQLHDYLGEADAALTGYSDALRMLPVIPDIADRVRERFFQGENVQQELEFWRETYAYWPDEPFQATHYGAVLEKAGLVEEAVGVYRRLLDQHPDHSGVHLALGRSLRLSGNLDEARTLISRSLTIDPALISMAALEMQLLGQTYLAEADPVNAAECFTSIIASDAGNAQAFFGLGEARRQEHRLHEASDAYCQAATLAPDNAWFLRHCGMVEEELGNTDTAIAIFTRVISMTPEDDYVRQRLDRLGQ